MKGHWIGKFSGTDGRTALEFIEDVTAKKVLLKPFVKEYLRRQQGRYVEDLKRKLEIV